MRNMAARMQMRTAAAAAVQPHRSLCSVAVSVRSARPAPIVAASMRTTHSVHRPALARITTFASSLRHFSAGGAAADSSASASAATATAGADREISIMAHYVGADAFGEVTIPAQLAARAWRFTQPSSLLVPLDNLVETPAGASSVVVPSTLSALFSLPPIPVAPIVRIPSESSMPASVAAALPSSGSLAFDPTSPYMVRHATRTLFVCLFHEAAAVPVSDSRSSS